MSSSFIKNVKLTGFIQLFLFSGSYESCSEVNKVLKDIFGMLFLFFVVCHRKYKYLKVVPLSKTSQQAMLWSHLIADNLWLTMVVVRLLQVFGDPLPLLSCVSITESIFLIRIKPAKGSLMKGMFGRHPIKSAYHFGYLWA